VAINATSQQNGSWIIEYYDPVVRAQMANPGPVFRLALNGYGSVWVRVEDGVESSEEAALCFESLELPSVTPAHNY
jgi:hypothetical protein